MLWGRYLIFMFLDPQDPSGAVDELQSNNNLEAANSSVV